MKKTIILSILVATGIISTANAQKGIYGGVQGGAQASAMYNQDDIDNISINHKATIGYTFGINGGYNFNKNMGVGTEVMYSMQGQRYEQNNMEFKKRVDYIKIPVLFSYNTNPSKTVMFTAKAGPQLGILMNSKLKYDTKGTDASYDTKGQYEKLTVGGTLGAGVRFNVAKNLYVDGGLRFDCAFTNAEDKGAKGYKPGRAKTYNANAGVEVGIKYFLN